MVNLGFSNPRTVVSDNTYKDAISCEKLNLIGNNPGIVSSVIPEDDTRNAAFKLYQQYVNVG